MSTDTPDFMVSHCNALNRAVEIARARYRKATPRHPDEDALCATLTAVRLAQDEYRAMVSRACEAWFDESAFVRLKAGPMVCNFDELAGKAERTF